MPVPRLGPTDLDVKIKFGGGLRTRAAEDEIGDREAASGHNFLLDVENNDLRPRPPFDHIGTAPNGDEIRGGGSFRMADGTVKAFFQAGVRVFEWDGDSFVASPPLDTVDASAKLRGHWRAHSWDLDGLLLVSDLSLLEPVKQWDGGVAFADIGFKSDPSTSFGSAFACKYISITDERAIFSNIKEGSSAFPHMVVGSKRSDFEQISVDDRPSSALGEDDPFFLLTPDLRAINGFVEAFGTRVLSSQQGRIFNLTGESAKDFSIDEFYAGSSAAGDESLAYIGNDVIYGRPGRIESVRDTNRFGDTEADDLSKTIADQVADLAGWRTVYNSRLNRVYLFPDDSSEVWVFSTAMLGGDKSPWMRWTTAHALAFRPTFVMSMLDPLDGLEYVFMGDEDGKIYRLEGEGNGDAGSTEISTQWTSKLFSLPLDQRISSVEGYVKYRKGSALEITIELLYAGDNVFDESVLVSVPASDTAAYYGGGSFYSDGRYYGVSFANRLVRQRIEIPGGDANEFQVRVTVSNSGSFAINEIGLRFRGAS